MPEPSFRDRFLATSVNRTVLSPLGIALGLALAAVAFAAGVPLVAAALLGALAWAARAVLAVPRRERAERIDPFTVQDPWRRFVQDALTVRNRFDEAVHRMGPGPLQENLREVAAKVHAAVAESYRVAQRGQALDQARRRIDVPGIDRQRRQLEAGDPADPVVEQVARSLDAQRETAARLEEVVAGAQAQLRLLDARMDEALVRAIEVTARSGSTEALGAGGTDVTDGGLGALRTDMDDVVTDLEALRQALEETHGTPGGLAAPGGAP